MDTPGSYTWWGYTQHISRREIEKMKKNMKKVPGIQLKTEIYHTQEAHEADKILHTLYQENNHHIINTAQATNSHIPWYKKILQFISNYFTPSP